VGAGGGGGGRVWYTTWGDGGPGVEGAFMTLTGSTSRIQESSPLLAGSHRGQRRTVDQMEGEIGAFPGRICRKRGGLANQLLGRIRRGGEDAWEDGKGTVHREFYMQQNSRGSRKNGRARR